MIGKPRTVRVREKTVAFVWEQFGPYHMDRCDAVADSLPEDWGVLGVEIASQSLTYAWDETGRGQSWSKVTLFPGRLAETIPWAERLFRLFPVVSRAKYVFFTGYQLEENFILSCLLRLLGARVFVMSESKFDDKSRSLGKELLKALLCSPYSGALVGGERHKSYFSFLGFRRRPVATGYDTLSLSRVRALGKLPAAPLGKPYRERPFVFVGRFVGKKNIEVLVEAFARYVELVGPSARELILVGDGELRQVVQAAILKHGVAQLVQTLGFLQAEKVAEVFAGALALVLPSREEQWGLVVNEALAFNLPIILSEACGSRDDLVSNNVNGYVIEVNNVEGYARAMFTLCQDEAVWLRMVDQSEKISPRADARQFGAGVQSLVRAPTGRWGGAGDPSP